MKKVSVFLNEKVQKIVKFLSEWHSGQSSKMYSVMSQLNAGKMPNKKEIKDCIEEINNDTDIRNEKEIIALLKTLK